ncbi:MAG TPA: BON domain-containing protein [Clostridia bacterium]|nr:BON domain-containing protein [Clostridia bacterium]
MKIKWLIVALALMLAFSIACTSNRNKAGNLKDDTVKNALAQAGYDDVRVDIDNDKGVVTLNGNVKSQEDKSRAEQVARSVAAKYVVANELGVRPEGAEGEARKVESNLDDAIKSDWKALEAKMSWENQHINADVKNGVLTLKGDVDTPGQRAEVEKAAAKLPHVQQVVNELEVKSAKHSKKAASQTASD